MASRPPYLPSRIERWRRLRRRARFSTLLTTASLLSGCFISPATAVPPTPTVTLVPPVEPTVAASDGWTLLLPGIEQRGYYPGGEYGFSQFAAIRIDPSLYTFRVHYSPGAPLSLAQWRTALPDAVAFINANFFDAGGYIQGLLVSDGVVYGQSYVGFGGLFQVEGGQPRVRSTVYEPYYGESLEQAVQAFPMLMLEGQPVFETNRADRASRRTVVGQDANGRVVFFVSASLFGMRLQDLASYLASTDLGLVNALNLDGGGSSLLFVNSNPVSQISSFDAVPAVIGVYGR